MSETEIDSEKEIEKTEEGENSRPDKESEEEDFKRRYFYLAAELENLKKRHDREKEGLIKYGNEKLLSSLLTILDDFDRSLDHVEKNDEAFKEILVGLEMVKKNFLEVLEKNGLVCLETVGKEFDPNFHEALAQQPSEGKPDGEIISELQKGYVLNGRLIRPAKVIIAKN
jgi:molecular chaperone GrpE